MYVTSSNGFRGKYQTYGGRSQSEQGGSGTVFVSAPNSENNTVVSVYVDNNGYKPLHTYLPENRQVFVQLYVLLLSKLFFAKDIELHV